VLNRIIFVVPAYNEAENIPKLLGHMREVVASLRRSCHIIVVDDGSVDDTGKLAREHAGGLSLEVVRHETNRGVGTVFRTGFRRALELAGPEDIIVTKEADNTSDLSILPTLVDRIEVGHDIALASCYAKGGGVTGSTIDRHILSFVANLLLRMFFPIRGVHTYSSFYRAHRAKTLRRAFEAYGDSLLEMNGFACMVEMLVKLSRLPISITEVPMVLQCDVRRGSSKMVRRRTIREYVRLIARQALRSAASDKRARDVFEAASLARAGEL
jgi:dolichol-phosphate mannosyltransferase